MNAVCWTEGGGGGAPVRQCTIHGHLHYWYRLGRPLFEDRVYFPSFLRNDTCLYGRGQWYNLTVLPLSLALRHFRSMRTITDTVRPSFRSRSRVPQSLCSASRLMDLDSPSDRALTSSARKMGSIPRVGEMQCPLSQPCPGRCSAKLSCTPDVFLVARVKSARCAFTMGQLCGSQETDQDMLHPVCKIAATGAIVYNFAVQNADGRNWPSSTT